MNSTLGSYSSYRHYRFIVYLFGKFYNIECLTEPCDSSATPGHAPAHGPAHLRGNAQPNTPKVPTPREYPTRQARCPRRCSEIETIKNGDNGPAPHWSNQARHSRTPSRQPDDRPLSRRQAQELGRTRSSKGRVTLRPRGWKPEPDSGIRLRQPDPAHAEPNRSPPRHLHKGTKPALAEHSQRPESFARQTKTPLPDTQIPQNKTNPSAAEPPQKPSIAEE